MINSTVYWKQLHDGIKIYYVASLKPTLHMKGQIPFCRFLEWTIPNWNYVKIKTLNFKFYLL